jgi:hypothetical protein
MFLRIPGVRANERAAANADPGSSVTKKESTWISRATCADQAPSFNPR